LGDLVVPELLGGLWVAVVGFGRIGEEGTVDGHFFPVLQGPFIGNSECQLKMGSETGHPLFGSSFREPGGGSLSEGPEGYEGRLWRWGISMEAQLGNLETVPLQGTLCHG
jgi:hypothetical protein